MKTTKQSKTAAVKVWEIKDRDSTRFGVKHEGRVAAGHHAEITKNEKIVLFGVVAAGSRYVRDEQGKTVACDEHLYKRTFNIGDTAEYDSYNLHYLGEITAISEKTVTIVSYKGSCNEKAHRLSLYEFDRRNWDMDLAETIRRNHETSMHI